MAARDRSDPRMLRLMGGAAKLPSLYVVDAQA